MYKIFTDKGFLGIIALLFIGVISSVMLRNLELELTSLHHFTLSVLMGLFPGVLWLYFFWLQDKYEREPRYFLLGVFILGGLLTYSFCIPLENYLHRVHQNFLASGIHQLLFAVAIQGSIQELTKFLVVRYSVYFSSEFNEPADGIIYSMAAGLGFAAVYNVIYLNSLEAINLSVVPARVIEFYLVNATFAGVTGYFMGKAKFLKRSWLHKELRILFGFLSAACLNGLYNFLSIKIQNLQFSIWKSLLLSATMTLLIYSIIYYLLQRSLDVSPFKKK